MTQLAGIVVVLAMGLAVLGTGCMSHCAVHRGHSLAHPTMTPSDVASSIDTQVRAVSEGSAGRRVSME